MGFLRKMGSLIEANINGTRVLDFSVERVIYTDIITAQLIKKIKNIHSDMMFSIFRTG